MGKEALAELLSKTHARIYKPKANPVTLPYEIPIEPKDRTAAESSWFWSTTTFPDVTRLGPGTPSTFGDVLL